MKKEWKEEFNIAKKVLKPYPGTLTWSYFDYEAFRYKSKDFQVSLIFYPHRTSASNYHIRVRDDNSKNKRLADELMIRLSIGAGNNCTFNRKHHNYRQELDLGRKENLEWGWARETKVYRQGEKR